MSLSQFKSAPMLRPHLNIGCLFDIQTGRYYLGKDGESILNGGLPHFSGVAGLPNMFKTVISLFQLGTVMVRYPCAVMQAHDSENTLSVMRILSIFNNLPDLSDRDLEAEGRLNFSDATIYMGNEWFDALKEWSRARRNDKELMRTTPFYNHRLAEFVRILAPGLSFLDSLSGLQTDSTQKMFDKAEVGEAGLNMLAMKASGAKSQMVEQIPATTAMANIFSLMTAHVGEKPQLDPYKPNIKKLRFLKGDLNLKRVPENFTFLTGNCWYCANMSVMLDDNKTPEFPRDDEDDLKGDTDLIAITLVNLRGKSGPSGIPFDILISQSEGVKVGLTEYYYLKTYNYYGLSDNNGNMAKGKPNYRLDLLPDVALSRKTIRSKIDESPALQRALTITSEMCQMQNLWHHLEEGVLCTPKVLFEDLKAKGYDWSILLNSRGYWTFEEDNNPLPFLSTMDLLNMRLGKYHPKWYPKSLKEMGLPQSEPAATATAS